MARWTKKGDDYWDHEGGYVRRVGGGGYDAVTNYYGRAQFDTLPAAKQWVESKYRDEKAEGRWD